MLVAGVCADVCKPRSGGRFATILKLVSKISVPRPLAMQPLPGDTLCDNLPHTNRYPPTTTPISLLARRFTTQQPLASFSPRHRRHPTSAHQPTNFNQFVAHHTPRLPHYQLRHSPTPFSHPTAPPHHPEPTPHHRSHHHRPAPLAANLTKFPAPPASPRGAPPAPRAKIIVQTFSLTLRWSDATSSCKRAKAVSALNSH